MNDTKKHTRIRTLIQIGWAALTNGWIPGYLRGSVYPGPLKNICVPGLNCYACPGALGSCPIGALQAVLGNIGSVVSFYMLGFFLLMGGALGRFICGFLCPFGLVQDLLHRIPFPRKIRTFPGDRKLRLLKYGVLILFVVLLPLLAVNAAGGGQPWFCKWICPSGTLGGGVILPIIAPILRSAIGFLYGWKMLLLAAVLLISILISRPFCKYLCPLGAIYALMNKVALLKYRIDSERCTDCKRCKSVCPMEIDPVRDVNAPECVRCGRCKKICAEKAIS